MNIKEQINNMFSKFGIMLKAEEIQLASAELENGTTIHTDGEDFSEGLDVYIINDEGEKIPLPEGDYDLADGGNIKVTEGGKIASFNRGGDGKESKDGKKAKVADGSPKKAAPKEKAPAKDAPAQPAKPAPKPKPAPPKKTKKSTDMTEEVKDAEGVEETQLEAALTEAEVVAIVERVINERFPIEIRGS